MLNDGKLVVKIVGEYAVGAVLTIRENGETLLKKHFDTFTDAIEELDRFLANHE